MRIPLVISLFFVLMLHVRVLAQDSLKIPAGAQIIVESGASISVNRNFVLDFGGTLNNAGTITINRSGAPTANFIDNNFTAQNYGTGKFVFTGTGGIQYVRGYIFNDFEINNAAGVLMLKDQTVNNNLNLINGSLSIAGNTLTLNGPVSGNGKLKGSNFSKLMIGGNAGTLHFDQADSASRSLRDISFNSASATLGNAMQVYGALSLTASGFDLNNQSLVLKSTGNGLFATARVGNLTGSTLSNASNVTVERYIASPQRAWHLLSTRAVTGSETIKQAWQENGGPIITGQGTLITSNLYNGSNGFDMASNSASILTHNQGGMAGSSYNYNLPNTNATVISSYPGYMLFVRGDRNYTAANAPATSHTVLRTTGTLTQGNQSAFISSTGTGRTLVANPYASPIDMENIFTGTTNLAQDMYIWDPSLTGNYGVGGFRLVERTGPGTYQQTPVVLGGPVTDSFARYIHSGQAFFLRTTGTAGTTDATVQFTESVKSANVSVVNPFVNAVNDQQLVVNLMIVNGGNIASLADGIRVRFDTAYLAVTSDDVEKTGNFAENISSYSNGKKLIVEKRPMIGVHDTIFLYMTNTGIKNYRFQLGTLNFVQAGAVAYLQDSYLNTNTPINLTGSINTIDFSITTDAASAAPGRFRIVFSMGGGPLPVYFTSIKAYPQNKDIAVEWKVSAELNIKHYEVERSVNGSSFYGIGIQTAMGNNNSDVSYTWIDRNPVEGNNFYRIRSVANTGDIKYSEIVKVTIGKGASYISVYPNPVTAKTVNIAFAQMEKGVYGLRLINAMGQVVFVRQLTHTGGNATLPVILGAVAAGTYQLEITRPDKTKIVKGLMVAD